MSEYLSISEAAAECGVSPKRISDLLWQRRLDPRGVVRIGGRHVVRRSYLPRLKAVLAQVGKVAVAV